MCVENVAMSFMLRVQTLFVAHDVVMFGVAVCTAALELIRQNKQEGA